MTKPHHLRSPYFQILVVIALLAISCSHKNQLGTLQVIDLTGSVSKEIFKLSDIAMDIEYVALETNKDCYIQKVRSFSVSDDYILIHDMRYEDNNIFLFDRKGRFIRQISRHGKGPGEYNFINNVSFSRNKNHILLFSSPNLYKFSMDGELVETVRFENIPTRVIELDNHYLAVYSFSNNMLNEGYAFNLTDFAGKVEQRFFHLSESSFNTNMYLQILGPYNFHDTLSFYTLRMDTIFGIDPALNILPRYFFKQNNWSVEENTPGQPDRLPASLVVMSFRELEDYIWIMGVKINQVQFYMYSKKEKSIWKIRGNGIPNDLDEGPEIIPEKAELNYIYSIIYAWNLLKPLADSLRTVLPCYFPEKQAAFRQFASTITEENNPILAIIKLKK